MPMNFMVSQIPHVEIKTRTLTSEDSRDRAMQMYQNGATWKDITNQTGLTAASIRYHLNRRGIPLRTK